MTVRWTEQAVQRLEAIESHVARDNPAAATTLVDGLIRRTDVLERFPSLGRPIPELPATGLRELLEDRYRVVYRVRGTTVEILTVFESHRTLRADEFPAD